MAHKKNGGKEREKGDPINVRERVCVCVCLCERECVCEREREIYEIPLTIPYIYILLFLDSIVTDSFFVVVSIGLFLVFFHAFSYTRVYYYTDGT